MSLTLLFCDAHGFLLSGFVGDGKEYPPGTPLPVVLEQEPCEFAVFVRRFPLHTTHILQGAGFFRRFRLEPLPSELAPLGGYVVCLATAPAFDILKTDLQEGLSTAASLDCAIFYAVFNDAAEAIILTDENFHILAANRKAHELYAVPEFPLVSEDLLRFFLPETRTQILTDIRKLKSGASKSLPMVSIARNNQATPMRMRVRCLSAGTIRLYQFMLRDPGKHMALERDLEKSRQEVAGMNIALKQIVLSAEEEKQELKDELAQQVRDEVLPTVERMAQEDSPLVRQAFRSALEEKIADIVDTSPKPTSRVQSLTPREKDICRLIQQGWQGRAIATELGIAFETLQTHRKNIRRKLDLKGQHLSLAAFLRQESPL